MRALLQRVKNARVTANGTVTGSIGTGILVFLGVSQADDERDADELARKVIHLRIFPDSDSKMNLSLLDIEGELLVISQFTLYADTAKGNRPSFTEAARPETAEPLYRRFIESCRRNGITVQTGVFQAHMLIDLTNDGPVTILCESRSKLRVKSYE